MPTPSMKAQLSSMARRAEAKTCVRYLSRAGFRKMGVPGALETRALLSRHLLHGRKHRLGIEWLLQKTAPRYRTGLNWRESGRVDHRQAGVMFAATFGNLPSVNVTGQPDVGDQQICNPPFAPHQG